MSKDSISGRIVVLDKDIQFFDFGPPCAKPSIYLQACLHSNEVFSFLVAHQLVALLKQLSPNIAVRVVPCANPFGWGNYLAGSDGRLSIPNGVDWNRAFDRIEEHPTEVERCLAKALWELSNEYERIIDIHTPEFGYPHVYTSDLTTRPLTFDDLPYVRSEVAAYRAFEDLHYHKRNVPAASLELPSHLMPTAENVGHWTSRVLQEIDALANGVSHKNDPSNLVCGKIINLVSPLSGAVVGIAEPNKHAGPNSIIVEVVAQDGQRMPLSYHRACRPLCFRRRNVVSAGSWAVRVLDLDVQTVS